MKMRALLLKTGTPLYHPGKEDDCIIYLLYDTCYEHVSVLMRIPPLYNQGTRGPLQ